jgi:hypothetical protein
MFFHSSSPWEISKYFANHCVKNRKVSINWNYDINKFEQNKHTHVHCLHLIRHLDPSNYNRVLHIYIENKLHNIDFVYIFLKELYIYNTLNLCSMEYQHHFDNRYKDLEVLNKMFELCQCLLRHLSIFQRLHIWLKVYLCYLLWPHRNLFSWLQCFVCYLLKKKKI